MKIPDDNQRVCVFCFLTDPALIFNESLRNTVFKDGKLQLLLKLMAAERIGERGRSSCMSV